MRVRACCKRPLRTPAATGGSITSGNTRPAQAVRAASKTRATLVGPTRVNNRCPTIEATHEQQPARRIGSLDRQYQHVSPDGRLQPSTGVPRSAGINPDWTAPDGRLPPRRSGKARSFAVPHGGAFFTPHPQAITGLSCKNAPMGARRFAKAGFPAPRNDIRSTPGRTSASEPFRGRVCFRGRDQHDMHVGATNRMSSPDRGSRAVRRRGRSMLMARADRTNLRLGRRRDDASGHQTSQALNENPATGPPTRRWPDIRLDSITERRQRVPPPKDVRTTRPVDAVTAARCVPLFWGIPRSPTPGTVSIPATP